MPITRLRVNQFYGVSSDNVKCKGQQRYIVFKGKKCKTYCIILFKLAMLT